MILLFVDLRVISLSEFCKYNWQLKVKDKRTKELIRRAVILQNHWDFSCFFDSFLLRTPNNLLYVQNFGFKPIYKNTVKGSYFSIEQKQNFHSEASESCLTLTSKKNILIENYRSV